MIEHRLEPRLIGLQRSSHHSDLVETIAMHLDQRQDFTADRRQLLLDPNDVRDGKFYSIDCCGSLPFPTLILMALRQWEKMSLEKSTGEEKGWAVLQWKIQGGRGHAGHRLEEQELGL